MPKNNITNDIIIKEFEKLLIQIKFDMDNETDKKKQIAHTHRLSAVSKVIKIIKDFPNQVKSSDDLKDIQGVGKHSLLRIDEIFKTGKLSELKSAIVSKKSTIIIEELEKVIGIGHKTAVKLVKEHNVQSINDLKKIHKKGKVELSAQILLGLKYIDTYKKNIPRSEIVDMDKKLHDIMLKIDPQLNGIICGSYRRLKTTSNDIDLLITHPLIKTYDELSNSKTNYLHKLVTALEKAKIIVDGLTYKDYVNKYMGFCRLTKKSPIRRIDIRYMPMTSYYPALLYFTGSGDFNKRMRGIAKEMDYKLNEYGIFKITIKTTKDEEKKIYKRKKVNSEKDIFDLLNMEYLAPEKRIN
jgi:DNA polymerase/3'-5' exonuclease PolX